MNTRLAGQEKITTVQVSSPAFVVGLSNCSAKVNDQANNIEFFTPENSYQNDAYRFAMDGCAIIAGSIVDDSNSLKNVITKYQNTDLEKFADWWGTNAKNPHALYMWDHLKHLAIIAPDPLGAATIFHYNYNNISIYTTSLEEIKKITSHFNLKLTKSTEFQLQRIVLGNGGYNCTPFAEVSTVKGFNYLKITPDGYQEVRYSVFDLLDKPYSYLSELERTRLEIRSSVEAIANSVHSNKISHITGGFDSRLLLSIISDLDAIEEFKFFCSGPTGTSDRIVADTLTLEYGLLRTNKAGLSPGPTKNLTEQLVAPLFHSQGVSSTGPNGRELKCNILAVGGGYGGLLRSTFGARMQGLNGSSSASEVFSKFDPYYRHESSILSRESFESIATSLHKEWSELREFYSDYSQYGDALYLHIRNRYHFGHGAMQWSRVGSRVDPLYSVHGYFLSLRSTPEVRASNIIGYDLLSSFNSKLLEFNFDKPKFDHELISKSRPPLEIRKFKKWIPETYVDITVPTFSDIPILPNQLDKYAFSIEPPSPEERKNYITRANKIGLNYWQIQSLESAQKILSGILKDRDIDQLEKNLQSGYLKDLATKNLNSRTHIRNLYSVLGASLWLSV